MHSLRAFIFACLLSTPCLALAATPVAQPVSPAPAASAPVDAFKVTPPEFATRVPSMDELDARDAWLTRQEVVQISAIAEVRLKRTPMAGQVHVFLLALERTPKGRYVMMVKNAKSEAVLGTYLVQDKYAAFLAPTGKVEPVVSPWYPAVILLGAPAEPSQLLQWMVGLPGKSFLAGELASLLVNDAGHLVGQEQGAWTVEYDQWAAAQGDKPAMPARVALVNAQAEVGIMVTRVNGMEKAPVGYRELEME